MSELLKCQEKLIKEAERKGYLTFDDIMDIADTYNLSVSEVDKLSEGIQMRGIIVYEDAPDTKAFEETLEDYSRVDYDAIFNEIITSSPDLEKIVNEVKRLPPPQYGEVQTLAMQAANQNSYARERLVTIHLRLALKIALSTAKQYNYNLSDAVSAAFTGLLIAVDRFDPNGFSAFQSYASSWIYQNIMRDCVPTWMEYYFPVHYKDKIYTILDKCMKFYGEIPEQKVSQTFLLDVADEMGITKEQVSEYLNAARLQMYGKIELDADIPVDDAKCKENTRIFDALETYEKDEEVVCLAEVLVEPETIYGGRQDPLECACETDLKAQVAKMIDTLKEREAEVIKYRFGFMDGREWTLEEVGAKFCVTRERIRQIEAKAIRKLKQDKTRKIVKDFI